MNRKELFDKLYIKWHYWKILWTELYYPHIRTYLRAKWYKLKELLVNRMYKIPLILPMIMCCMICGIVCYHQPNSVVSLMGEIFIIASIYLFVGSIVWVFGNVFASLEEDYEARKK